MSTRLTKMIREQIAEEVLRHRFREPVEQLAARRSALANDVYCDVYKKGDRERMHDLPEGWLPTSVGIRVQFGTDYELLHFSGRVWGPLARYRAEGSHRSGLSERRILTKHVHNCAKVYEATHHLAKKHAEIEAEETRLRAEYETAKARVWAALESVTTLNRLIEAWPEVEPFAVKHKSGGGRLPALKTQDLNKMLDLPIAARRCG